MLEAEPRSSSSSPTASMRVNLLPSRRLEEPRVWRPARTAFLTLDGLWQLWMPAVAIFMASLASCNCESSLRDPGEIRAPSSSIMMTSVWSTSLRRANSGAVAECSSPVAHAGVARLPDSLSAYWPTYGGCVETSPTAPSMYGRSVGGSEAASNDESMSMSASRLVSSFL